jgi:hypothetical protein
MARLAARGLIKKFEKIMLVSMYGGFLPVIADDTAAQ